MNQYFSTLYYRVGKGFIVYLLHCISSKVLSSNFKCWKNTLFGIGFWKCRYEHRSIESKWNDQKIIISEWRIIKQCCNIELLFSSSHFNFVWEKRQKRPLDVQYQIYLNINFTIGTGPLIKIKKCHKSTDGSDELVDGYKRSR